MSALRRGRIDPLELLREFTIEKKVIKFKKDKDKLQFDHLEIKSTQETAWQSTISNRQYNLGTLWFFLDTKNQNMRRGDYLKKCIDLKFDQVAMLDEQEILNYFHGKIENSECVNAELKSQLFRKLQKQNDQEELDQIQKKVKTETLDETQINLRIMDEILKFEKPITSKTRLLRSQDQSFESLLNQALSILSGQSLPLATTSSTPQQISKQSFLSEIAVQKIKPIIIVPQIVENGNVCLRNIVQLLEQGVYVDPCQCKFEGESRKVQIDHTFQSGPQTYQVSFEIVDNWKGLTDKQWKRVVAVFVRGSQYEFKGWPYSDMLARVRGFLVKFEDDRKDSVKGWDLRILELSRNKRHLDQQVMKSFWEDLFTWLKQTKPK